MPAVRATHARMEAFAADVRTGRFTGQGGPITDVVNIGIGGSDLGPAMAMLALAPYADGPRCHFVSNVDGAHIHDVLQGLNPETTLVIVASKTFTTIETMTNAETAQALDGGKGGEPGGAVRRRVDRGRQDRRLRHRSRAASSGSRIGSAGAIRCGGRSGCRLMLADRAGGFRRLPRRRRRRWTAISATRRFAQNLPVLLALVGIWHNQVCGYATRAVLPYDQRLLAPAGLPSAAGDGEQRQARGDGRHDLTMHSGPVVWGEPGHERPARLLPADPSGHAGDPLRIPGGASKGMSPSLRTSTCCWWQTASRSPRR